MLILMKKVKINQMKVVCMSKKKKPYPFRLREKTVDCKDIVQLVYSFFSHHGSHVGAHKTKEWQPCCFYLRELI